MPHVTGKVLVFLYASNTVTNTLALSNFIPNIKFKVLMQSWFSLLLAYLAIDLVDSCYLFWQI